MKLQSLLNILSIFIVVADSHATPRPPRPLNDRENQQRLSTCGMNRPDSTWFWVAHQMDSYGQPFITGASKISKRHFITFSHFLIFDKKWRRNGTSIGSGCEKEKASLKVPTEELSNLKFRTKSCFNPNRSEKEPCQEATPVNAYLLNFCDQETPDIKYTPMIVEVEANSTGKNKDLKGNDLCLMGSESNVKMADQVKVHRLDSDKGFEDIIFWVSHTDFKLIWVPNIPGNARYGGPLLNMDKWKVKLIGYSYSDDIISGSSRSFFQISWFADEICQLAGICELSYSEYSEEEISGPLGSGTKNPRRHRKRTTPFPGEEAYDYDEYAKEPNRENEEMDYFGVWTENSGGILNWKWMILMVLLSGINGF